MKQSALERVYLLVLYAGALGASLVVFSCCSGKGEIINREYVANSNESPACDLSVPANVDPELWDMLTAELARVLAREGTARRTAAAPTGFASKVPDLSIHEEGGQAIFTWSYRQHGDYDLNGIVTVSDLTQVGVHFGKTTTDADWQVAQLADGDGNGEVGVSDVTPIGQNFGGRLDGYELQGRTAAEAAYLLKAEVAFTPGDKLSGLYPQYLVSSAPVPAGPEYRVVPYVQNGGNREYGQESNIYRTLTSNATNWYTKRGDNSRRNLARAAGPASPDEVWELDFEGGIFFLEPIMDLTGTIYIGTYEQADLEEIGGTGYVYAVDQAGTVKWRFKTVRGVSMPLAASRNGRVVTGDLSGLVYCLAPDGKQLWRQQLLGLLLASGTLVTDTGEVYCLSHIYSGGTFTASTLYKLTAAGEIDWSRPLHAACLSSPFFNTEDEVTVIDKAGELYSFDDTGASTENFMAIDQPLTNFFLGHDVVFLAGFILYTTDNGRMRIVAEDDTFTNSINLGEDGASSPTVNAAGKILLGTVATNPNPAFKLNQYTGGIEDWEMAIPGTFLGGIVADTADRLYISTYESEIPLPGSTGISCILPDQTISWFYPTDGKFAFTPIIADENLLVCALMGDIYGDGTHASLIGIRSN